MPVAGEALERAADDRAVPDDLERARAGAVRPVHRSREAGVGVVGLRRALIEGDAVPLRRPGAHVAGDLRTGDEQLRRSGVRAALRVLGCCRDAEPDARELLRPGDALRPRAAI